MDSANYYISTDQTLLDAVKVHALLKDFFWAKNIPPSYVRRFMRHSLCFGVYTKATNELAGFGRVISDYTTFAYVCDVVIDPRHRRHGLANALISTMMHHPDLQGLQTWSLRTTEEARRIYQAHGFELAVDPHTILEIDKLGLYEQQDFVAIHE